MKLPSKLRELKVSEYKSKSVKEEIRDNLIAMIRAGDNPFPGIIGYDETVLPQLENALISCHDIMLVGQRGQGKTRLMRSIAALLDPLIPVVDGCQIHDDPLRPICRECRRRLEAEGDDLPVRWIGPEDRYVEKLATPDVTPADLIGDVDPIKIAEGRYLSDEETIHFGLVPRAHRGIFAINELPELNEKIQVGLFNVLEERDLQIRGFQVRLPLDVLVIATCNPEDYTHRGRIVTPLKDRFGSQIKTHYPVTIENEMKIMEAEAKVPQIKGTKLTVPPFMKEIVAGISMEARRHPEINQTSGVSVRMTIDNYENLMSQAIKRALKNKETEAVPRVSDLSYVIASSMGKMEFECIEPEREAAVMSQVIDMAIRKTFSKYFDAARIQRIMDVWADDLDVEIPDKATSDEILEAIKRIGVPISLFDVHTNGSSEAVLASSIEMALEGLHQKGFLSKRTIGPDVHYRKGGPGYYSEPGPKNMR